MSASLSGEDILAALADARADSAPGISVGRLAEVTGRPRKLVTRIVEDLAEIGFVEVTRDTHHVHLGWGLRAMAAQVADQRLTVRGQVIVERLAIQCRESAYLVTRRGVYSVTLAEAMPDLGVRGVSWLGRSQPVLRGDAGPILLMDLSSAQLATLLGAEPFPPSSARHATRSLRGVERLIAQARRDGYLVLDEQVENDVASAGAPVFDFRGRLAGAVHVLGPSNRLRHRPQEIRELVMAAAADLTRALGGTAHSVTTATSMDGGDPQ